MTIPVVGQVSASISSSVCGDFFSTRKTAFLDDKIDSVLQALKRRLNVVMHAVYFKWLEPELCIARNFYFSSKVSSY